MAVGSIVDWLKSQGKDSSYSARKNLASQYGISDYRGTAQQNTQLLAGLQGRPQSGSVPEAASNAVKNAASNVFNGIKQAFGNAGTSQNPQYETGYQYNPYQQSDRVNNYAGILDDLENNRPSSYQGKYDAQIDSIIDSILNREDFKTDDVYQSDLYKNYRDQYVQQGQKAMRDTIGQATAMTGGYGSTYATAAGQQAYDSYLSQLGDKSLDIYDRVYNQYLNEGQELYNQLNMVNTQDGIDYGRYRDGVSDYYNDLSYYSGRYNQEYANDWNQYSQKEDAQRWAEEYAYQRTQDALAQQNWQTQFDYNKEQDAIALAMQQAQMAARGSSSGGSGGGGRRSSGGSSGKSSKSSGSSMSSYVDEARRMLEATDDNNEKLYDSGSVMEKLWESGLSDSDVKKVIKEAGGDWDLGLSSLKSHLRR